MKKIVIKDIVCMNIVKRSVFAMEDILAIRVTSTYFVGKSNEKNNQH